MNMFNRSTHYLVLIIGIWLSATGLAADDVQDASRLFKQGQHDQAQEKVDGFLATNPKDAQARFLKGLIFTEQGKVTEAIEVFLGLTKDYPELPEPYNNLAVLYATQGQYDKARLALEMAIRTHPSYATAHENLGDIYAKMASQAYDRAFQLDRSNTATKTKLAMIQDLFAGGVREKSTAAQGAAAPAIVALSKPEPVKTKSVAPVAIQPASAEKSMEPASALDSSKVLKAVNAWATAWSDRNVKEYLSFYAADFKTPGGESRETWEATRHSRLRKPKFIEVKISNVVVEFGSNSVQATVKFNQSYQASHLKTSGKKTLLMLKSGDNWLIQEEYAH